MVFPRSDGRFVSRGYGWATLLDPANPKKGMKAAIELDGLVIDEVSQGTSWGKRGREGRGKERSVVSSNGFSFGRELTFLSSVAFLYFVF